MEFERPISTDRKDAIPFGILEDKIQNDQLALNIIRTLEKEISEFEAIRPNNILLEKEIKNLHFAKSLSKVLKVFIFSLLLIYIVLGIIAYIACGNASFFETLHDPEFIFSLLICYLFLFFEIFASIRYENKKRKLESYNFSISKEKLQYLNDTLYEKRDVVALLDIISKNGNLYVDYENEMYRLRKFQKKNEKAHIEMYFAFEIRQEKKTNGIPEIKLFEKKLMAVRPERQ